MAYVIGNLVGRLLLSAIIVLVVMFIVKKFDMKKAMSSMKRPLPVASVVIIFFLGLLVQAYADRPNFMQF